MWAEQSVNMLKINSKNLLKILKNNTQLVNNWYSNISQFTHYSSVLLIYTPENIRIPYVFLMFSGGVNKQHRAVMGQC